MSKPDFKVLILGGGNCGLAIATGLEKAGIKSTVYERDTEDDFYNRPRDWGMLLHWGAEYLERLLPPHLTPGLMRAIRCDPNIDENAASASKVPFVNSLTGEVIAEIPMQGVNRVSRMKLRRFLTVGRDLDIQFGKHAKKITVENEKEVSLTFRDGSLAKGHMIIGADGSHSKVREFLVGAEAAQLQPVNLTMINFPLDGYTADEAALLQSLNPVFKIAAHPNVPGNAILAALDIVDSGDPSSWKFQNYVGWWGPPYAKDLQDMQSRVQFYKTFIKSFCEPFRTAGLKVDDNGSLPIYPGQQWAPSMLWDTRNGKVTLVGDAAHSMLPQRGQGLNNALKDASGIVHAIKLAFAGEKTLAEAVADYESEMKPRGVKEVELSLEQARAASNLTTLKESPIFKVGWKPAAAT